MKLRPYLYLLILLIALLSACQPKVASPVRGTNQPSTQVVAQPTEVAPLPTQPEQNPVPTLDNSSPTQESTAYPGPQALEASSSGSSNTLYPDMKSGDTIPWPQAQAMILNGEVAKIVQGHSLQVTLFLKDGRSLLTTEPAVDDVTRTIQICGERCKDITVATE